MIPCRVLYSMMKQGTFINTEEALLFVSDRAYVTCDIQLNAWKAELTEEEWQYLKSIGEFHEN